MAKISELIELASTKTGLSREEVLLRIRNKQKELSGLVSEEGAAFIVANELGVKTRNKVVETILKLKELKPDMKSVSVMGRVKAIYGPREFTTKTGVRNKVVNMEVVDSTGVGRVVLWNMHDIEKIEKGTIKPGQVIHVKSGYVRESSFTNSLEVHVGNKGILIENPENVSEDEFPDGNAGGTFSISELKPDMPVSIVAKVTNKYEVKEFDKNGRKGKVGNLIVNDGTASTRVVLWNEQANVMDELKVGDILKIENGYSKTGLKGVEVQANNNTKLTLNPKGVQINVSAATAETAKRKIISELKDGEFSEVKAAITSHFGNNFVYEMCVNCNKKVAAGKCEKCGSEKTNKLLILNLAIDDGSGTVRAAVFRETAEKLLGLKAEEAANPQKTKVQLDQMLGREMVFQGRVKRNDQFDRLEFNVVGVKESNAEDEIKKIVEVS